MKRREFITLLGSTAAWPFAVRAQQAMMPVVGFIGDSTQAGFGHFISAFRQGLSEAGYVEGRNLKIEHRWANYQTALLPALADDLVSRQVAVIVANYGSMAAVKAATTTILIVFVSGEDPVTGGLVANLNKPGGNVTGVSFFDVPLAGKRMGLLHELFPKGKRIALLLDTNFSAAAAELRELETTAQAIGQQLLVVKTGSVSEIDGAFPTIAQSDAGGLLVGSGPFFTRQRERLVALATRLAIPAIYVVREFAETGGPMSYGASQTDAYRRAAGYVGRILTGEKPGDMPVELPSKFELVINLKTAKALGLTLPPGVLAIADEVIE